MKIKVYMDFDEDKLMTEKEFLVWKKDVVDKAMEDKCRVRDVLDSLGVSAGDMFFMDNEDLDNLRKRVRDYLFESFDDDYDVSEYELEV